ncbi:MAG: helix-turn-helix transcriptional regulator [Cyanobacteria bacterium TGS_CYA1]|nr:helix-turn-helix transcriptional regulator [Cyanobacteria bacterium TGS_CYA1]
MKISTSQDLGNYIRAIRKSQSLTIDDVASACGVGNRFLSELERGKATCQIGKFLTILAVLGIEIDLHTKAGENKV